MRYVTAAIQVFGSAAIIAAVPGNASKVILLLILWALTFGSLSKHEKVFATLACGFFSIMNAASLHRGIFAFTQPDLFGMPLYEFFMWGFYLLHARRFLNGPIPEGVHRITLLLALMYSLCFIFLSNSYHLLLATSAILLLSLFLFHERGDLLYTFYMIAVGAVIEYSGVYSEQWNYPNAPVFGVPLWFITLWGGVGLFLRRIALPVLSHYESKGLDTG